MTTTDLELSAVLAMLPADIEVPYERMDHPLIIEGDLTKEWSYWMTYKSGDLYGNAYMVQFDCGLQFDGDEIELTPSQSMHMKKVINDKLEFYN